MHNNEISVILGSQWKTETAEIKARYQELAQFIKEQHRIQHPDYQYQPRKASERKRRKSRRKVAALNSEVVGDGLVLGLVQPGTIQAGAIEAEPAEEVDTVDHEESLLINDDMEEIDNETVNTKWHHRGGAMYTLQAPIALTTRGLQSVLSEFNKHHAIEADVSRDFQYPVAPIEIRRTEEAEFKEHSIFNMIDWAAVEKDAMQIEMELAAEYELKKSQHRLPDPLM
ncbi:MAG: hypothetical protein M1826_005615 [Phylliscum demangeonii]|nr:MAG: hypothetical protein M1826_005615 [Phylliscum demangeonii]